MYKILVENSDDSAQQAFTVDGLDYGMLSKQLTSLPWERIPCKDEMMWIGENAAVVESIHFHPDGMVTIIVDFHGSCSGIGMRAMLDEGYAPVVDV